MWSEWAGFLQIEAWPPVPGIAFWAALALVTGALVGEAVRRVFGVPRIVGYSGVGLVLGLAGFGASAPQGSARLIVDLALALLMFELGSRVRLRWLRANPALLLTSAAESLASICRDLCRAALDRPSPSTWRSPAPRWVAARRAP